MVEEIITALTGIRRLFVLACNSTFARKGKPFGWYPKGRGLEFQNQFEPAIDALQRSEITATTA